MKICQVHNQEKVLYGRGWTCRECNNEAQRKYYAKNTKTHVNRVSKNRKNNIQQNRQNIWNFYKSHPCVDCGESNPMVLEADHITDKKNGVSRMVNSNFSWDAIQKELTKCEIRCANCHRIRTANQFGWYKDIIK